MKVACFFSLVACVAGFGFVAPVAEDAPTTTEEEETCESLIARGADLTCSACCPNECAKFEDPNVPDAYKTLNEDTYYLTYTYDFRGHDGCVCFNDKSFNSDYWSVHLTEGNDCALVMGAGDIYGLGGDDTLMSLNSWGSNKIYGGAGDDHVKVLHGWEGYEYYGNLYFNDGATRVEGGDGEDSVVIYRGGAVVDGDVETITFDDGGECAESGVESGARICEHDAWDYYYNYYY
jgi:hypothetical protein